MKRRITVSIALFLSIVLVSLTSSDSTARAQQPQRFVADLGFITLNQNEVLRISAVNENESPPAQHILQFKRIEYTQGVCNGGVCKHTIASQTISDLIRLMPREAASFDITPMPNSSGVRGVVLSNSRDVQVTAIVFDTSTQRVVAFYAHIEEMAIVSAPNN